MSTAHPFLRRTAIAQSDKPLGILENHWMADHATAPAHTRPLLVLDMYEHAFHMDYGAAAARYIDAWFANLNWEAVAARA